MFSTGKVEDSSRAGSQSDSDEDIGSGRSSPNNSLFAPPPDLRPESRYSPDPEEMVELIKHDKAVLDHAKRKKWVRLSLSQFA
jgi:hypothetical protein